MASDWEETILGELIEAGDAHLQTGPFGTALKAAEYSAEGVPLISVGEVRQGHFEISDNTPRVSVETTKRLPKFVLETGDIVFGRKGGIDRNAIVHPPQQGWFLGSDGIRLRLSKKHNSLFFSYQMRCPATRAWLLQNCEGTTMPSLNQEILGRVPIVLPPLSEQKAIAHILGTLDDKIELNRRMNETLEAMARVIFKSWFVDFDPVRAKMDGCKPLGMDQATAKLFPDSFEESELGPMPSGWRATTLGKVAQNVSNTFDFDQKADVVFVNTGDVLDSDFLHGNRSHPCDLPGQAKKSISRNDILLSEIRPANKRFAYVDFDASDYVVSTKFMVIRGSMDIHPRLLYRILTSHETLTEFQVQAESRSGTFPQITFESVSYFPIVLPPLPIQEAYQRLIGKADAQIKNNKVQSKILAALRDALLPRLLSGELRVKEAEKFVEARA